MDYKLPIDYKKPDDFIFPSDMGNGYKSPINLNYEFMNTIENELSKEIDRCIITDIMKLGVNVNKKELIKALQYDREQYDKGYQDAKRQYDRKHGHWIEFWDYLKCSNCDYGFTEHNDTKRFSYCPNCGAKMDEEEENDRK